MVLPQRDCFGCRSGLLDVIPGFAARECQCRFQFRVFRKAFAVGKVDGAAFVIQRVVALLISLQRFNDTMHVAHQQIGHVNQNGLIGFRDDFAAQMTDMANDCWTARRSSLLSVIARKRRFLCINRTLGPIRRK